MSLVQFTSAQAMQEQAQAEEQQAQARVVDALSAHVKGKWEQAKQHKLAVANRLTDCLRRYKGEYSADKLAKIESTGGATIYMNITGEKVRAAKAWLSDLFAPTGDKPFTLEPTPVADLPPEIQQTLVQQAVQGAMQMGVSREEMLALVQKHEDRLKDELKQEAEARMERMSDLIEDALVEGNYRNQFDEFLDDYCVYPSAIMKAPVYCRKKKIKWVELETGEYQPKMSEVLGREVKRVSPFNAYPSPNAANPNDDYFIEHIQFSAGELANLRSVKGYKADAIAKVLHEYRLGGLREWMFNSSERDRLEGRSQSMATDYALIDGIEYCGTVQGRMLIEWGMAPQSVPDPYAEYPVSLVMIGNYVIRALINPDPTGRNYYYKASMKPIPNAFWGEALAEQIADLQDAANATARALINNMSIGSAPQVAVDVSMLPKGAAVTKMHPWKIWKFDGKTSNGRAGINFFQPEIKADELLRVYERFVRYADERSGIPSYAYGSDSGAGAAKTASGLSMLLNAAGKTIKQMVRSIDIDVIEPLIAAFYTSMMLDPDVPNDAKGDATAKARGSDSLMHKEAAVMRQQELLQMTNNPTDMAIIGMDGRREQLKEVFKSGDIPVDRIIPTQEELEQRLMQQQQQQMVEPQ